MVAQLLPGSVEVLEAAALKADQRPQEDPNASGNQMHARILEQPARSGRPSYKLGLWLAMLPLRCDSRRVMRGVPSILVSVKRHPVARWIAAIAAALTALGGMGAGVAFLLDASNQVAQELVATTPGSGVNGDQLGGFGPARESYDYSVAPRECVRGVIRHDRCGSMDRAVFNSFINIPSYGDERAFFDGRDRASPLHNGDPIEGVAPDDQLTLRTFINNDANDERAGGRCDDQARGVARNTRISLQASPDVALQTVVRATIAAANAASVYDDVTVRSATPFLLAYVPGSAELLRDNRHVRLSDDIATPEGALVGWHEMDGTFPGCFDAAALVEARFVVVRAG